MGNKNIIISGLAVIGIMILLNMLGDRFFFRLDFTADQRYTLSEATKDILKNLEDPVTISAYFTENLPPQYEKVRTDFEEMLVEFGTYSRGKVVYEFINPNESDDGEQQAAQNGVAPLLVNVREKDEVKQIKAFMGAKLSMGEQSEVIPFLPPNAPMEYSLASSIKKISVLEKPAIGIVQGHGEPDLQALQQAQAALSVLYSTEPLQLGPEPISSKYKTLAIIAPTDSFNNAEFQILDEFLSRGGNLMIAMNHVTGDFQTSQGTVLNTGLKGWLLSKGIVVEDNFVVDANCGQVGVRQQQGFFSYTQNVQFPFLPIIQDFADHPITKGLEGVIFQFASALSYTGDSAVKFTPILKSSKKSGTQAAPTFFNVQKNWQQSDFPMQSIAVGGVFEGKLAGEGISRIVLITDGDFAVNGAGQQAQQVNPDNVSLLVNGIDWLSDDTGLIDLRTKGITNRPLEEIEDAKKAMLKYLNFFLPILLIIIYGIIRWQMKARARRKRMEVSYV